MDSNENGISTRKLPWHYSFGLVIFWLMVYVGIAVPQGMRYPQPLTIRDEVDYPASFIAERAKNMLRAITKVGPRIVGSEANEVITIEVLKAELERIKTELKPQYELEIDIQMANGNFVTTETVFNYQFIQNFIVKLSSIKFSTSDCLLLNSHYDTVPQSPGAGDDGSNVAVMLEIMRVLAKSNDPLKHSIVFLFNGAEETGFMGSHAFITQHKWAKDCKAVINLDSAGWGGRLLLFQIGPNQGKLLEHYRKVPHPFASALGEELFQTGITLSNTDYHVFRKFGNLPGYDMAFISNGYVYHTRFDRFDRFPLASLQHAGNNVLALVKSLDRSLDDLNDTTHNQFDNMIYYDIFGYIMVKYTKHFGILLNLGVCIIASLAISLSVLEFGIKFDLSFGEVLMQLGATMMIQIFALLLGASLTVMVATILNNANCALSWYTNKWLLLGLYFCPMFFGMLILPALTIKHVDFKCFYIAHKVKLLLHAHCVWLILITIILTILEVRSAFLGMFAIAFYTLAVFTNLSAAYKGGDHGFWFIIPIIVSQIVPFTYFTSLTHTLLTFLIPIMGQSGVFFNSELLMSAVAIVMSTLFAGFIMPLFLTFRKTVNFAGMCLCITLLCITLAFSSIGMPFKAETSVQRFEVLHEHHIIHGIDHGIETEQSFISINIFDRSIKNIKNFRRLFYKNPEILSRLENAESFYDNGDLNIRFETMIAPKLPYYPILNLLKNETISYKPYQRRFTFQIITPNYANVFLSLNNTKIVDWSFATNSKSGINEFPLRLRFISGRYKRPFEFSITFERLSNDYVDEYYFDIGISGQWYERQFNYVSEFRHFIDAFPNYAFVDNSLRSYEKWSFQV